MNFSVLQLLLFMLSVISFNKVQSTSWPPWIQSESCYERIIICERYDRSNPTCSNREGHLGSNGFRITGGQNELEIEGRSVLLQPNGGIVAGGSIWMTTIGLTETTSVLTPSYNIDLIECESKGVSVVNGATTITATYSFLCGNEVIEPVKTGIVYFKDLRTCNNSQLHVVLVAVRQVGIISNLVNMHTTEGPKSITTEGHFTTSTHQESNLTTEIMTVSSTPEPTVRTVSTRVIPNSSTVFHTTQHFNGCLNEVDDVWSIAWPNTLFNHLSTQPCPHRNGHNVIGEATRYCDNHGSWSEPNVLNCVSVVFLDIEVFAESILNISNPEVQITQNGMIIEQLIRATEPQQTHSLLPTDLQISTRVLSTVIGILEDNSKYATNENVIDIFNNLLDESNREGWSVLQDNELVNGSEKLLNNAERYSKIVAASTNTSEAHEGQTRRTLSRTDIVISVEQTNRTSSSDFQFPINADLVNYTASNFSSKITIPKSFVENKMNKPNTSEDIFVSFILFRFLPMGEFIPVNSTTLMENECSSQIQPAQSASDILSAQIGLKTGNVSLYTSKNSFRFQENPIRMNFTFPSIDNDSSYLCVFWNFSDPIGNGSWATSGVTTDDIRTFGSLTTVQCSSAHLTSFAVLVDVTGGLSGLGTSEKKALQIVSYIGCGISMMFLIMTIIYFLLYGKKLFTSVNFFIHLNLSITLLLALIVFVSGIKTATTNQILCIVVAALLHYFFLSAFCWMLCEGVMLYLKLVVVFSKMARQWWPFFVIGYFPAMPIVAITVGVRYNYYCVKGACGELLYCWLSVDHGTIFGFVGPMMLIILINVIFLMFALRTLWRSKRGQLEREKDTKAPQKLARAVFVASVVLLPLLGLTWLFGILTVNANSTIFAWLFTIFNSLQGMFIFFFHVVRSDKVWSRINAVTRKLKIQCHCVKQNSSGSGESGLKMKRANYQDPYSAFSSKQSTCKTYASKSEIDK